MGGVFSKGFSAGALLLAVFVTLTVLLTPHAVKAATVGAGARVIVQYSPGTSTTKMQAEAAVANSGAMLVHSFTSSSSRLVSFAVYSSDTLTADQLAQQFAGQPGVVAVSPDYMRHAAMTPNDTLFGNLWGLRNTGQAVNGATGTAGADINATTAWDTVTGAGTVLADIDSGVDYTHPDLAANMWVNPGEIPGDGIDNDGNGYIDDVYGIDAAANDSDPMDEHGHGTHTAGTIAAVGNNNAGVIGVAYGAKVMALRFLDASGSGADSAAITCINYAIDMKLNHGVNIVAMNNSWGGTGYDTALYNAITSAANAGIVFVAAAGNNGANSDSSPFYPAAFNNANIISVGASTSSDTRASSSNYGATAVDVFAPGVNILSTYPNALGGYYAYMSGTSMATPHVTGAVALVAQLHPSDSVATRISRVLASADRRPAFSGLCATGARLDAANAVATGTPSVTSLSPSTGPPAGGTSVTITGTGFAALSGASAVTFGGTNATSYTVNSPTQITAVAPAHAAGVASVRVTSAFGTSPDTASDDYTYVLPVPAITSLNPASGYTGGGTSVTINGTGFTGATTVLFDTTAATTFTVNSDTRITATAPAHAAGAVRVQVTTPGGTTPDTVNDDFTYLVVPEPTVSGLSPNTGPIAGGTSVIITGTNLTGASAVSFGGTAATTFTVNSAAQITATAPAHAAGTFQVQVTAPGGSSAEVPGDDYTYVAAPTINSLAPPTGPTAGGTSVVITGTDFTGLSGASAVTFGGVNATSYTVNSATQIAAVAPAHLPGAVRVQVTALGGTTPDSANDDYTYTSPAPQQFQETDAHISYAGSWTSFPTTSASGGAYERANTTGSSASIYFNGDRLDWIAMKGTTTGKADVYLDDVFKVTIDLSASVATYQVNVWSTGVLPSGMHHVTISWNTGNVAGKYITLDRVDVLGTLVYPAPAITSLAPTLGSTAGGTTVTINGSGFLGLSGASAVAFGGVTATSYTVNSATKITAVAPAHASGAVRVQVTAAGGVTPDTAADDYTYVVPPTLTRLDATATNTAFVKTGTWAPFTTASAIGGSYLRSSTAGATVTITFSGMQLDWIATKGTTTGKADVYVDNVLVATVNLAASTVAYQQRVFSTGILVSGTHTVRIVRRSDNLAGKYITLDAVDVGGSLVP